MSPDEPSTSQLHPHEVHDLVGGLPAFQRLVDDFYSRVEHDELMRPLYPEDLGPGKRHLALFLAQYWGGGNVYGDERGHPRLRMRHAPFPITPEHARHWADHMMAAVRDQGWPADAEALLFDYVIRATPTLVNQLPDELRAPPGRSLPGSGD